MADTEVQILIKAVDEATAVLKKIEGQVETTARNSEKSNKSLGDSFKAVQGAMLNLGQVAQGIHNIFETQQRITRNLENAQDRLENATLRLKRAQQELNDAYQDAKRDQLTLKKATLEHARAQEELRYYTDILARGSTLNAEAQREYEDALIRAEEASLNLEEAQGLESKRAQELKDKQDALTIATNGVERAQRSLEKAQGDVTWGYAQMAIQMVSVAGNAYTLTQTLGALSGAGGLGGVATAANGATGALGTAGTATAAGTGLIGAFAALSAVLITLPLAAHIQELSAASEAYRTFSGSIDDSKWKLVDLDEQMKATTGMGGTRQTSIVSNQVFDPATGKVSDRPAEQTAAGSWWKGGLKGLYDYLVNTKKKSDETHQAVQKASEETFTKMGTDAVSGVRTVNVELDKIPKDIYTYHHIITVYG